MRGGVIISQLDKWVLVVKKINDIRDQLDEEREDIRKILQGEKVIKDLGICDMHYLDGKREGLEQALDLLPEVKNYDNPEDN